jgi:hypothetical protein
MRCTNRRWERVTGEASDGGGGVDVELVAKRGIENGERCRIIRS